jgi:phage terminase small subunit
VTADIDVAKLKTVAHERFVQEYVASGHNGQNAYMVAFPKSAKASARASAARLLKNSDVQRRIAEIQSKSAQRTDVTLEGLIKEAGDIQREAMTAQSYAAAVSALIAKAKLSGLWVERTHGENTNVNYAVADQPPSEEDWQRQHVTAH